MSSSVWKVTGCSTQGLAHEKLGLPCQDAHAWHQPGNGLLLVAVADGAGSAPLAHIGAPLGCQAALAGLRAQLESVSEAGPDFGFNWSEILRQAVAAARTDLQREADARHVSISELATTLIVVVACPELLAAIQIGDGAIVLAESDEAMRCIGRPAQSEYLNETTFVTSATAMSEGEPVIFKGAISRFAVLTDGLQMASLRMPEAEPHPGFFAPLFRFLEGAKSVEELQTELGSFLQSPRVRQRTDDDVTVVIASLRPG